MAFNGCPRPFLNAANFMNTTGFIDGRLCSEIGSNTCCLPCPMTDWVYPESFNTMGMVSEIVAVVSTAACIFLLLSWAVLPVEKTHRHYLSICLTIGVVLMNLGFVIPLAASPEQCADAITPHDMKSSSTCAASGAFLIFGGWLGVMWIFLRALSLHLQICWGTVAGKTFMWFAHVAGWGIPLAGIILTLVFSGVSFRFGSTCHVNHQNSLAVLWIPLLVFAGFTIAIQFGTFGYCVKVYLASLADNSSSTGGSGLPTAANSIKSLSPRQTYRRVRRVVELQWRGILIVLIILADVVYFSIVFVFQDRTVENIREEPETARDFLTCLFLNPDNRSECFDEASKLVISEATAFSVLLLLGMNGFWLLLFLGRWTMITAWSDFFMNISGCRKPEFVSADARFDMIKNNRRSYEMLSRDTGKKQMDDSVTPSPGTSISMSPPPPARQPSVGATYDRNNNNNDGNIPSGRRTPDYLGQAARYHAPMRSFSSPRPPPAPQNVRWDSSEMYGGRENNDISRDTGDVSPLSMNRI
ncbi:hypothetical protein MCOR25_000475 [Pyricularia grisea]|nr:hypothetical protein MCOR25_000475 [Pyricularia grisea]